MYYSHKELEYICYRDFLNYNICWIVWSLLKYIFWQKMFQKLDKVSTVSSLYVSKCYNTSILYTLETLLSKHYFYFFFSYLLTCKKNHQFLRCYAIDTSSLFNSFSRVLFFKFNMLSQNCDKSNSIRIIFLIICMIKISFIEIYIKNALLTPRKYDITRILIKI